MKRKTKRLARAVLAVLTVATLVLCPLSVSAKETLSATGSAVLSPALSVLAAENEMAVATLCGNDYYFSEDVFARTLNLSAVDAITVLALPEVTEGELLMGAERVSVGQRIEAKELSMLCFAAVDDSARQASFTFSPSGGGYEMVCNIHVLSEVNYSPTVSLATSAALAVSTYRDFVGYGTLSAYDPEGDALVFEVVKAPKDGVVVMTDRACGEYVYLPREGFVGEDSFCYVARDEYGNYSAMAQVNVTVQARSSKIVYADMAGRREYNAVLHLTEAGIMQGVQSEEVWNFDPDSEVNRGEFLVMAMQAIGVGSVPKVSDTGFDDDEQIGEELKGYVAAARDLGYIEGVSGADGSLCFSPNATITRAEAAVILCRMIGSGEDVTVSIMPTFADGQDIPVWASEAIAALNVRGVLSAVGGAISPNANVTRADAASMLSAMMRLK